MCCNCSVKVSALFTKHFSITMSFSKSDKVPIKCIPNDDRVNKLDKLFKEEFGYKPSFFVRVPGRVNLIGEHIDYCGYPVLPMALEQDILIAATKIDKSKIQIRNVNKKYPEFDYFLTNYENIKIQPDDSDRPYWYNYILCGIKGAMEHMDGNKVLGLQLFVDGNVPPASGLSSSSALVSAACLSFLYANNIEISKSNIASLCASCERYIGTQGGGMDQAIAFLAEKSCAQYITWQPLKATAVALPKEATFVVAHSLAEANKAATNDFNRRVMECRLAAKILANVSGLANSSEVITLSQVQELLGNSLEEMIQLVLTHLSQNIYTKHEICKILNISQADLDNIYLTQNTKHIDEFKLKQRALHVYEEARRVDKFRTACSKSVSNGNRVTNAVNGAPENRNGETKTDNTLQIIGKLMSESHESLKNNYECSHENLDRLVDISKKVNVHSRLTGAGWGGCIIALCPKDQANDYIKHLKKHFYEKYYNIDNELANKYVFATIPNHGAIIYTNEN